MVINAGLRSGYLFTAGFATFLATAFLTTGLATAFTAFLATAPREKTGMYMREAVIEQLRIETKKGIIQQGMLDERILIRNN